MAEAGASQGKVSLWKVPGFPETMVAVAAAFGAWSLLLPVLPMAVLDAGGSNTLAGGSTGAFMAATVITQMFTPWLLSRFGYRPVMAVAAGMLGIPALGHLLGMEVWQVLLFSALRGVGFGALTVAESALIAELVPLRLLGKATGTMGLFIGLSQMIFLPVGLAMAENISFASTYYTAAAIACLAVVMCLRLPSVHPRSSGESETAEAPRASTWKLVIVPALALTTLSMSYGVVSSFLPASVREIDPETGAVLGGLMLSIVGGSVMVSRLFAGVVADRLGEPGHLYIPAQVIGGVGMLLMAAAMINGWSVWWMVLASVFFGIAFGIAQNEALLSMFNRLPRSKISQASAVWNIFYDAGTGLGSVVLAALVTGYGYAGAYGAGGVIILAGILMTGLDTILGRHRVAEIDNIRTRLRRLRKAPARNQRRTVTRTEELKKNTLDNVNNVDKELD
ncbi:MFS transporter [Corynebacterium confusum]|uniref:MFS transporter n=1 Tax=uncultured Corynebacterium sp. TaxID=159447 RepID=UPI0025F1DF00|nr:MFS transporter [uncultured Corynebacterium sp.]